MTAFVHLSYLLGTLAFVLGLKFLSSATKARTGNLIAAIGMAIAVGATLLQSAVDGTSLPNMLVICFGIITGGAIGKIYSDRVEMTAMPQLVSLFNALGGACAMLLGVIESQQPGAEGAAWFPKVLLLSGVAIGAITFSGSIIAYLKLAAKTGDLTSRLAVYGSRALLALVILFIPVLAFTGNLDDIFIPAIAFAVLALIYGVLFVKPIGGADMPVVISLLNSLSGVATALVGGLYGNKIMIAGGILVGAAGVLLTVLMCKAMNRSLFNVLAGTIKNAVSGLSESELNIKPTNVSQLATQLAFAQRVAIIPGYGMAVSQAQHACFELQKALEKRGTEVSYIIHPVAGRMPGHMNVLLAEADVDYEKLVEMKDVNDSMERFDVSMVIGANDVVNPAAEEDQHSPIYGMPIIKAYKSKYVVVIKRGMSKGYSGVANTLFGRDNCYLLFGDAKSVITNVTADIKSL